MAKEGKEILYAATAVTDCTNLAERSLLVAQHYKKSRFFPKVGGLDGYDGPAITFFQTRVPSIDSFTFNRIFIAGSAEYEVKYTPAEFKRLCGLLAVARKKTKEKRLGLTLWVHGKTKKGDLPAFECSASLTIQEQIELYASVQLKGVEYGRDQRLRFMEQFFGASPLGAPLSFEAGDGQWCINGKSQSPNWKAVNQSRGLEHFSTPDLDAAIAVLAAGIEATFDKKLMLTFNATLLPEFYEETRGLLNELQLNWTTTLDPAMYARSPWERPQVMDAFDPPRFPVVGYAEKRAQFQIDVVHGSNGSFLEIAANSEELLQQVGELLDLPMVRCDGDPHQRWIQSHGVDPQTPTVEFKPKPAANEPPKKKSSKKTDAATAITTKDDAILDAIRRWRKSKKSELRVNFDFRSFPPEIGTLTSLTTLQANRCGITDLPDEICQLKKLETLELDRNLFVHIPKAIRGLTQLRELSLNRCGLVELPDWIGELSVLNRLDLIGNELTALPDSLGKLSNLGCLSLYKNRLVELPPVIGELGNLTSLGLGDNQITEIPTWIQNLKQLCYFIVYGNRLKELPKQLGDLSMLIDLNAESNQLVSLPNSLRKLTRLKYLRLNGNQLTELPEWIGDLTALERLSVENNCLKSLPRSLLKLKNLQVLSVYGNPELGIPDSVLGGPYEKISITGRPIPTPASILSCYFGE